MEVTWSIIDSSPKIVIFCWGWLRYKLPVQGWGWWDMKRFIVCMVAFRESLKGDLKVLPRGWRKNIVLWADSYILWFQGNQQKRSWLIIKWSMHECRHYQSLFLLMSMIRIGCIMHVHCTYIHIYIPWASATVLKNHGCTTAVFFRDFHLFPDALRLHFSEGSLWAISLEKLIIYRRYGSLLGL